MRVPYWLLAGLAGLGNSSSHLERDPQTVTAEFTAVGDPAENRAYSHNVELTEQQLSAPDLDGIVDIFVDSYRPSVQRDESLYVTCTYKHGYGNIGHVEFSPLEHMRWNKLIEPSLDRDTAYKRLCGLLHKDSGQRCFSKQFEQAKVELCSDKLIVTGNKCGSITLETRVTDPLSPLDSFREFFTQEPVGCIERELPIDYEPLYIDTSVYISPEGECFVDEWVFSRTKKPTDELERLYAKYYCESVYLMMKKRGSAFQDWIKEHAVRVGDWPRRVGLYPQSDLFQIYGPATADNIGVRPGKTVVKRDSSYNYDEIFAERVAYFDEIRIAKCKYPNGVYAGTVWTRSLDLLAACRSLQVARKTEYPEIDDYNACVESRLKNFVVRLCYTGFLSLTPTDKTCSPVEFRYVTIEKNIFYTMDLVKNALEGVSLACLKDGWTLGKKKINNLARSSLKTLKWDEQQEGMFTAYFSCQIDRKDFCHVSFREKAQSEASDAQTEAYARGFVGPYCKYIANLIENHPAFSTIIQHEH